MRKFFKHFLILVLFFNLIVVITTCSKGEKINIFSVQDDINLGKRVRDQILNNPKYVLLPEKNYPQAYRYLQAIRDTLLAKSELNYANRFDWNVYILQDDTQRNAFVTPGGYIFIYTGLLKYLETEDQLAGILAHEMAHADQRHATENLSKIYGVTLLLQVVLGENQILLNTIVQDLTTNLIALGFNQATESQADISSVKYLSKTQYACNGIAGFFEKILKEGQPSGSYSWLSTHPDAQKRLQDVNTQVSILNCQTTVKENNYPDFLKLLP